MYYFGVKFMNYYFGLNLMANEDPYSWILSGTQRMAVLKALSKPMTPSLIREKSICYNEKVSLNNCSNILRRFVERGLAVCINEQDKRGRIYKLTELGEEVREQLMKE